jgi:hypothetical protein
MTIAQTLHQRQAIIQDDAKKFGLADTPYVTAFDRQRSPSSYELQRQEVRVPIVSSPTVVAHSILLVTLPASFS